MENVNTNEVAQWVQQHLSQPMNKQSQQVGDFLNESVPKVMLFLKEKTGQIEKSDFDRYQDEIQKFLELEDDELERYLNGDFREQDFELTPRRMKQMGILLAFLIIAWKIGKTVFNFAFIAASLFLLYVYLDKNKSLKDTLVIE